MAYIGRALVQGNYIKLDDLSSQFNGSTSTFSLKSGGAAYTPGSANTLLVSLGGVIQEPIEAFTVTNDQITFTNAPTAGTDVFIVALGAAVSIGTPADGSVTGAKLSTPFNYVGVISATSFNSVGVNTAQAGFEVGALASIGATISASGNATFAGIVTTSRLNVGTSGTVITTTSSGLVGVGTTNPRFKLEVGAVGTSGTSLHVNGDARVTGILTVGSSSVVINGANDQINVGTAVTISSSGLTIAGVVTATTYRVGSGSTAAPSITPTDDTNTGIFFPSADTIAFGEGGSEAARIDSSGRLLVGTTSWSGDAKLIVRANVSNSAGEGSFGIVCGSAATSISSGDTVGNLDFMNNAGGLYGRIAVQADAAGAVGDHPGRLVFSTTADGQSFPTERMRIDSSGRLGIGTSSPGDLVTISDSTTPKLGLRTGNTQRGEFRATSAITSLVSYNSSPMSFIINDGTDKTAIYVDSSQRVGIGTTSPGQSLDVNGNIRVGSNQRVMFGPAGYEAGIKYASSGNFQIAARAGESITFNGGEDGTERARIDSSGRLLIGTSSTSATCNALLQTGSGTGGTLILAYGNTSPASDQDLGFISFNDSSHIYNSAIIRAARDGGTWTSGTSMPTRLTFSTTADGASSPTERFRLNSNGQLCINTTTATTGIGHRVFIEDGTTYAPMGVNNVAGGSGSSNNIVIYRAGTQVGSITTTNTATAYNTSSDYRLKENVTVVTDGITRLQQLKPSRFNFIADSDKTVDGFIAHEVQDIVPEAITGTKDEVDDEGEPVYQGIDQSKLVPLLTAALQEAIGRIETLEAEVAALKAQ